MLEASYRYSRPQIAAALEGLLAGDDRIGEHSEAVQASLKDFKAGRLDFTDALIVNVNLARCEGTATFDRKAARHDGFIRVS